MKIGQIFIKCKLCSLHWTKHCEEHKSIKLYSLVNRVIIPFHMFQMLTPFLSPKILLLLNATGYRVN